MEIGDYYPDPDPCAIKCYGMFLVSLGYMKYDTRTPFSPVYRSQQ